MRAVSSKYKKTLNSTNQFNRFVLKILEEKDQAPDPSTFVSDIMKIISENPKLYDALAEDKYDS